MSIKSVGVFCGSSIGKHNDYSLAAVELGQLLVEQNIEMIYGGGKVGLMGVIADEMMANNGNVIGIIPDFLLQKEVGHEAITEMKVVENMSQRKNLIGDLSDAFIAMPGGFGTLDEVMEVLTYFQLGISEKPVGFLNVNGFYDPLIAMFDRILEERFMKYEHRHNLIIRNNAADLLKAIQDFQPLEVDEKWIADLKERKTY
jgi:uncharacterized protein (TIGR00730 family)